MQLFSIEDMPAGFLAILIPLQQPYLGHEGTGRFLTWKQITEL